MLADPDAAELNRLVGQASRTASPRQFEALLRIYWFTLEFGLVEDKGGLRAYGAGLLSSFGELPHAFTEAVERMLVLAFGHYQVRDIRVPVADSQQAAHRLCARLGMRLLSAPPPGEAGGPFLYGVALH